MSLLRVIFKGNWAIIIQFAVIHTERSRSLVHVQSLQTSAGMWGQCAFADLLDLLHTCVVVAAVVVLDYSGCDYD